MAEAFEEGGDAVEAGPAGVHAPQHRIQLVRDPLLLGEGGENEGAFLPAAVPSRGMLRP